MTGERFYPCRNAAESAKVYTVDPLDHRLDLRRLVARNDHEVRRVCTDALVLVQRQLERLRAIACAAFADEGHALTRRPQERAGELANALVDASEDYFVARHPLFAGGHSAQPYRGADRRCRWPRIVVYAPPGA